MIKPNAAGRQNSPIPREDSVVDAGASSNSLADASTLTRHATRAEGVEIEAALLQVVINNLSIVGNCIGLTRDLESALDSFDPSRLPVPVAGVFTPDDGLAFLELTFNERRKFGKVVMIHSADREGDDVP